MLLTPTPDVSPEQNLLLGNYQKWTLQKAIRQTAEIQSSPYAANVKHPVS